MPPSRDRLRTELARHGIETRPLFHPVHTMPMYAAPGQRFAVAEDLAARGMNLPSWPGLDTEPGAADCFGTFGATFEAAPAPPVCEALQPGHTRPLGASSSDCGATGWSAVSSSRADDGGSGQSRRIQRAGFLLCIWRTGTR